MSMQVEGFAVPSQPSSPKFGRGVSMLAWAYNEEELIGEFVERALAMLEASLEDYELIIVDDGSQDRTWSIISAHAQANPRVRPLKQPKNTGVAQAASRAIHAATKEFLFWQTVDWSYDLSNFRRFLDYLGEYDMVCGVRRIPAPAGVGNLTRLSYGLRTLLGAQNLVRRSDNIYRGVISVTNYMLIRLLFQLPLSDYQNISIYRTDLIQRFNIESHSSFSCPELLFKGYWSGARIKEVPISFIPRNAGQAKGARVKSILQSITDIFTYWYRWIIRRQLGPRRQGSIRRLHPQEWR